MKKQREKRASPLTRESTAYYEDNFDAGNDEKGQKTLVCKNSEQVRRSQSAVHEVEEHQIVIVLKKLRGDVEPAACHGPETAMLSLGRCKIAVSLVTEDSVRL